MASSHRPPSALSGIQRKIGTRFGCATEPCATQRGRDSALSSPGVANNPPRRVGSLYRDNLNVVTGPLVTLRVHRQPPAISTPFASTRLIESLRTVSKSARLLSYPPVERSLMSELRVIVFSPEPVFPWVATLPGTLDDESKRATGRYRARETAISTNASCGLDTHAAHGPDRGTETPQDSSALATARTRFARLPSNTIGTGASAVERTTADPRFYFIAPGRQDGITQLHSSSRLIPPELVV
jgi:hypothetical protein